MEYIVFSILLIASFSISFKCNTKDKFVKKFFKSFLSTFFIAFISLFLSACFFASKYDLEDLYGSYIPILKIFSYLECASIIIIPMFYIVFILLKIKNNNQK